MCFQNQLIVIQYSSLTASIFFLFYWIFTECITSPYPHIVFFFLLDLLFRLLYLQLNPALRKHLKFEVEKHEPHCFN